MFDLFRAPAAPVIPLPGGGEVPLLFRPNRRARNYIVRIADDGAVTVTIPRGGSKRFALDFARRHAAWISTQLSKTRDRNAPWHGGREILYRGARTPLERVEEEGLVFAAWAGKKIVLPPGTTDLRPAVTRLLRGEAARDLKARTARWAAALGVAPAQVVIRAQRTLWGSCSARKTISLNWRLIQAPEWVADYIVVHELVHLIEMNHSRRYWDRVAAAFPRWHEAEAWLKANREEMR